MRSASIFVFALAVSTAVPAAAQPPSPTVGSQSDPTSQRWLGGPQGTAPASLAVAERGGGDWTEYQNIQDGFTVVFPGQPRVTDTTWTSEYGYMLPARLYSASRGPERYSVTVVDYNPIEQQGIERRRRCPAGAEPCIGSDVGGAGHWKHDVRGALIFATSGFLGRDAKVTRYNWGHQDLVEGHHLQLTNADGSRTFAFVGMHEMKLYILEGTVPAGSPEPGLFQQSMGWVDKAGRGIRYQTIYANQFHGLNEVPQPARAGRGGGAGTARQP